MKIPDTQVIFGKSLQVIIIILTLFIIAVLVVGLLQTLYEIKEFLFKRPIGQSFNIIVVDILTFLVIIELFRGFIAYFEVHRFRLSTMIDPAIVFVIRELIVKLYGKDDLGWQNIAAFGFLLLCLGIIRSLAVKFSPGDDSGLSKPPPAPPLLPRGDSVTPSCPD